MLTFLFMFCWSCWWLTYERTCRFRFTWLLHEMLHWVSRILLQCKRSWKKLIIWRKNCFKKKRIRRSPSGRYQRQRYPLILGGGASRRQSGWWSNSQQRLHYASQISTWYRFETESRSRFCKFFNMHSDFVSGGFVYPRWCLNLGQELPSKYKIRSKP